MFDSVLRNLMTAMLPTAVSVLADNMDSLRRFLAEQALETDNGLDDVLVDVVMDWLEKYLEEMDDVLLDWLEKYLDDADL